METRMFDFAGFYNRMAIELPDNCRVCEVGVADGESAIDLANQLHLLGKNFKLYMVDNMAYGRYVQMKTIYQNIIKSGLGEFIEVIPYESIEASKLFNNDFLHFVFIDASHKYQETKNDIKAWYPKVIDGYILAGHDYFGEENPGVRLAVDEVIPKTITREPIEDGERTFSPESFLFTEQTEFGFGIWGCKKDFYKHLK